MASMKNKINIGKIFFIFLLVLFCLGLIFAVYGFYYQNLRGINPVIMPPPANISDLLPNNGSTTTVNQTDFPLKLPQGFLISVLAKGLDKPRDLAFDSQGNLWVSETESGRIKVLELVDEKFVKTSIIFQGLKKPHGIAFDPKQSNLLYIAEEDKISRVQVGGAGKLQLEKVVDLPSGGRHITRSLVFDEQGNLFVSIGSTCDVCHEKNIENGTIMRVNLEIGKLESLAKGLRNAVFMAINSMDGKIWATEMGRDQLGDNLPPDEINIVETSSTVIQNFGWPICYGKNIHDTLFDKNTYIRNPCQTPFETPSFVDLPAHSAPLGIVFANQNKNWPKEYQNDVLVAFHGSWNRSIPTGYKIVRIVFDEKGDYIGQEDFVSGWLTKDGALGRPVDMVFNKNGNLFISDDKAGVIYELKYGG